MLPHECHRCRSSLDTETDARYRRMLHREGFSPAEVDASFDADFAEQHAEHERERTGPPLNVYMDRGTLDLGIRRDPTLPTNDMRLFIEEWERTAIAGGLTVIVDLPGDTDA